MNLLLAGSFMSCMIFCFNSQSGDVVLKNSSCGWNLQLVAVYHALLIEISKGKFCIHHGNVSRNIIFLCFLFFLWFLFSFASTEEIKGIYKRFTQSATFPISQNSVLASDCMHHDRPFKYQKISIYFSTIKQVQNDLEIIDWNPLYY